MVRQISMVVGLCFAALFTVAPAAAQMPPKDEDGPPIRWRAVLTDEQESAPTYSPGSGVAEFVLDRKTLRFTWKVTFSNLTSEVIGAAIHGPQTVGGEANALWDLAPKGLGKLPLEGYVDFNDGDIQLLTTDRFYVQIRTKKYPAGELRGQLVKQRPNPPNVSQ